MDIKLPFMKTNTKQEVGTGSQAASMQQPIIPQTQQPLNPGTPTPELKPKVTNPNLAISQGMNVLDAIAPQNIEEDFDYFKINDVYFRTIFVGGYPRFVAPGWLEP